MPCSTVNIEYGMKTSPNSPVMGPLAYGAQLKPCACIIGRLYRVVVRLATPLCHKEAHQCVLLQHEYSHPSSLHFSLTIWTLGNHCLRCGEAEEPEVTMAPCVSLLCRLCQQVWWITTALFGTGSFPMMQRSRSRALSQSVFSSSTISMLKATWGECNV